MSDGSYIILKCTSKAEPQLQKYRTELIAYELGSNITNI